MTEPWTIQSAVPGVAWPGLPLPGGAQVLGLLHQFEDSQWWSEAELLERQQGQLELLLTHAYETVPYYRERWGKAPDAARLHELPLLTRRDLQERFSDLKSRATPPGHGAIHEASTSGSSGTPVRVQKTALVDALWSAFTLRDHLWHRRDLGKKLAVIRNRTPLLAAAPELADNWGPATATVVATGQCLTLGTETDIASLLERLVREHPAYLLTYPLIAA